MIPEAVLERRDGGLVPAGHGWFVVNVRNAQWLAGAFGAYARFEGDARFPQLGINIGVLQPGQPACMYHGEGSQEDFLVLAGECVLLVEGRERPLRAWDFVHCPPWTEHVIVGAGSGPCTVLSIGARPSGEVVYPASPLAQSHDAGVERETRDPAEAYASFAADSPARCDDAWLPG